MDKENVLNMHNGTFSVTRGEIKLFARKQMKLEAVMLSEISQSHTHL